MWQDLGLNLIAEAIGIIATVLGIDQLLKWRERRRWARIKRQVLTRIRGTFSKVLAQLAVQTSLDTDFKNKHPAISQIDIVELMRSYTQEKLTAQIAKLDTIQWRLGVASFLQECLSEIRETTNTYNMLMEPELLTRLFSIEEIIQRVQSRISVLGLFSRLARLEKGYQKDKETLRDQLVKSLVELILVLLEMDAFLAVQIECQDNASVVQ